MKRRPGRPPWWFVPAILLGSAAVGSLMAAVVGSTMQ
jgi:hypothetical protein